MARCLQAPSFYRSLGLPLSLLRAYVLISLFVLVPVVTFHFSQTTAPASRISAVLLLEIHLVEREDYLYHYICRGPSIFRTHRER